MSESLKQRTRWYQEASADAHQVYVSHMASGDLLLATTWQEVARVSAATAHIFLGVLVGVANENR